MSWLAVPGAYFVAGITLGIIGEIESHHSGGTYGRRPEDTSNDNKTSDPVTNGQDYAGLARPVYGPIGANTVLGIGAVLRSNGVATGFERMREIVMNQVQRVSNALRKRPRMETRSWARTRQRLEFGREIWHDFARMYHRGQAAYDFVRRFNEVVNNGRFHMEL